MVAPPNHGNAAALSLDSRLRILIVSPVRLLRDGLATMVKQRANVQSVAVAESTEAAIMVLEPFRPTFILLDVATEDGLSAARRLVATAGEVRILGFAARTLDHDIVAYASAGISGFVPREASAQDLFDAIDRTAKGELLCSPRIAAAMFKRLVALSKAPTKSNAGSPQLTEREAEIVRLIEDGLSNKEIARHLSIEVSTVKNHVHNILEKLHVSRRGKVPARIRVNDPSYAN